MKEDKIITLSDYLNDASIALKQKMGNHRWIVFDIIDMKTSRGHYYLEIGELDDNKTLIASSRITIWSSKVNEILDKFKKETGFDLVKNTKIMALCNIAISPKFGLSMNMIDINPTYTLGVDKSSIKSILTDLDKLGITNNNKRFDTPIDFKRVLVLSPNNAAGLGDFKSDADKLDNAGVCKFDYFHATFQGESAPDSIRDELVKIFKKVRDDGIEYDALVMIRGGGSTTDLNHLNSMTIARAICQFNIPVYVGVGHERDETVLDYVANMKFDTPSKVVLFIKNTIISNYNEINSTFKRINNRSISYIDSYINRIELIKKDNLRNAINITNTTEIEITKHRNSIDRNSLVIINNLSNYINNYSYNLKNNSKSFIDSNIVFLNNSIHNINTSISHLANKESDFISNTFFNIKRNALTRINDEINEIQLLTMKVDKHNPIHIKKLGYGIVKTNKGSIKSVGEVGRNKKIIIEMIDGLIYTNLEKIEIKEELKND